jgi:hypothetical protein
VPEATALWPSPPPPVVPKFTNWLRCLIPRRLVALLDRAQIPHMVAGSFASTWPSGLLAVDVILW